MSPAQWDKPIPVLQAERWMAGKREHRTNGGGFNGDPLREALEEAIDGLNYTRVLIERGHDRWTCKQMEEGFRAAAVAAQTLYSITHEDDLQGRFVARLRE